MQVLYSRGDGRESVCLNKEDSDMYMTLLAEVSDHFNWSVRSWCQMTYHYPLLVETPDANLSKRTRYLKDVYTQCLDVPSSQGFEVINYWVEKS